MNRKNKLAIKLAAASIICTAGATNAYALTQNQWRTVSYMFGASAAWGMVGGFNSIVRNYVEFTPYSGEWGQIAGTICGTATAGLTKPWNPPQDEISMNALALASLKSGVVIASTVVCNIATSAAVSNTETKYRRVLTALEDPRMSVQKAELLNKYVKATAALQRTMSAELEIMRKARAEEYYAANEEAKNMCGVPQFSHDPTCQYLMADYEKARRQYDNANLRLEQATWDLASELGAEYAQLFPNAPQEQALGARPNTTRGFSRP